MPDLGAISGLAELRELTHGDPRVRIAIIDGHPDLEHPAFEGADLELLQRYWDEDRAREEWSTKHATGIASVIFGQPGSLVEGIAPRCHGLLIPAGVDNETAISEVGLARAIELALEHDADVIHCAFCQPSQTGSVHDLLARAVAKAVERGVAICCPAGNNHGTCWCAPAVLPGVLPVGAVDDDGRPTSYTNWGGPLDDSGVVAPGENVLCAVPGGGTTREKGTSLAAPIVSAVVGLLLSVTLAHGKRITGQRAREALLETAKPSSDPQDAQKYLRGLIDPIAAARLLLGEPAATQTVVVPAGAPAAKRPPLPPASPVRYEATTAEATAGATPSAEPSIRLPSHVYALGGIGYDFGTQAHRDAFAQRMDGSPADPLAMVAHLEVSPIEARDLIWTLGFDGAPLYALRPVGAFASEIYLLLVRLLEQSALPLGDGAHIERIGLPGLLTAELVELESAEQIPVVRMSLRRGVYGWSTAHVLDSALDTLATRRILTDRDAVARGLGSFFEKVYYELRNPGVLARDRALNFAATNAVQGAEAFAEAIADGFGLAGLEIEKSPYCRLNSDCWDLKLTFFDAENSERARRVYRYTVDVADAMPVTVGSMRRWAVGP